MSGCKVEVFLCAVGMNMSISIDWRACLMRCADKGSTEGRVYNFFGGTEVLEASLFYSQSRVLGS